MGLTDSKMAAEVLSGACSNAEKSGKDDIKAVLTDPKVLGLLHNLWSNLPDTTKRKIDPGMAKRQVDGRPENDRPKKVRKLRKSPDFKFALFPDFMAKVSAWTEDPLSFFNEGESQLKLTRSPFDELNTYMSKLTKRTEMDTIRLRLLKVMYYRLSGCVGWTQLHQKRTERMVQTTSNSDILAWVNEGKRIDKLCRDIGCVEKVERSDQYFHLGNLFYSLQDVADYFIKELPLKGDPRPEEVARLKKRSSLSETGDRRKLEILAHKLTDRIWNAFQNAESGLEPNRHPAGYSPGQDAQSFSRSAPSPRQDSRTSEEAVFGAGVPVCSTEVTTFDHERTLLDENLQSTLLHSPVDRIVMHEGTSSVPQPTSQFRAHWMTNSESLHPADRPASLRPSSLSDFTDTIPSSIQNVRPVFFGSTSLCPTSVSDFFSSNSPSLVQDTHPRSCHPASICPTSISDFTTQGSPSTQNFSLSAMSLYPASFSDFTGTVPTSQSLRPGLFSDFTQTALSQPSVNSTSDGLVSTSQAFHTDIAESPPHIADPVHGSAPIVPRIYSEQSTALADMAPQQIMSI